MGAAVPRWPPMFARPYMECRGCLRCGRSLKSAFFVWLYGCVSLCGRPVKRAWCMQRGVCLKLRIAVQDTLRPAA
ncbi:hypothetical protein BDA96_06G229400 [Sorghum bicolor]|uniref:Uncharacterized protein n=1 Tax=Sorghum bicolor TaxID=4558 RepID=A0A921QUP1_SORBI|nr:hypothetical protein BDA96_06G229400 [Sorghum bicolor]